MIYVEIRSTADRRFQERLRYPSIDAARAALAHPDDHAKPLVGMALSGTTYIAAVRVQT
jgi:hypothetical protein